MAVNPTKVQTVIQQIGAAIKFPTQLGSTAFVPNGITINNRSASTIQVGPGSGGPFILCGQFTLSILPWTYGGSIYVQEVGTPASHLATEFLQIDFLAVDPRSGGVGAGTINTYATTGWGSIGPGNALVSVNSGDPFQYGQIQQLVNLLTGVMTGQIVTFANELHLDGAAQSEVIRFLVGGLRRWFFGTIGAETGANAGSDLELASYNDAGGLLHAAVIRFFRGTGGVYVGDTPIDPGANSFRVQGALTVGGLSSLQGISSPPVTAFAAGGVFVGGGPSDPGVNNLEVKGLSFFDGGIRTGGVLTSYVGGGVYVGPTIVDPGAGVLRAESEVQAVNVRASGFVQIGSSSAFYSLSGAPGAGLGVNGDMYFNQAGGAGSTIYQKRAGAWVALV